VEKQKNYFSIICELGMEGQPPANSNYMEGRIYINFRNKQHLLNNQA